MPLEANSTFIQPLILGLPEIGCVRSGPAPGRPFLYVCRPSQQLQFGFNQQSCETLLTIAGFHPRHPAVHRKLDGIFRILYEPVMLLAEDSRHLSSVCAFMTHTRRIEKPARQPHGGPS
tara:strand:+ start:503 stop:859 length:357 start_codon:yes stop_codon:yes gene_type:complete